MDMKSSHKVFVTKVIHTLKKNTTFDAAKLAPNIISLSRAEYVDVAFVRRSSD